MKTNSCIEERLNAWTHAVGLGLAVAALFVVVGRVVGGASGMEPGGGFAAGEETGRAAGLLLLSGLIYGISQVLLYLSSSLTHQFQDFPRAHYYLRIFDQIAVYLLIAGTYTPVTLVSLRGQGGMILFVLEWILAVLGILSKLLFFREKNIFSDLLYLPMGWMILVLLPAVLRTLPAGLIVAIFAGGGIYSLGVFFYISKKIPYSHVIWHLFVLGGSVSFFTGYVRYVF